MDDSPLSITSSITGILTFVVAILAAIYIRYTTLMNGRNEMHSIFESVLATVQETRDLSLGRQSWQDPEHIHMGRLLVELYSTELSILGQLADVTGQQAERNPEDFSRGSPEEVLQGIFQEAKRHIESQRPWENSRLGVLSSLIRDIPSSFRTPSIDASLKAIQFLASLGTTPALMHWYRVRKDVLENVRKRENIRSRLLFLQVSEANAVSRAQNERLGRLEERLRQVHISGDRTQHDMHELTMQTIHNDMDRLANRILIQNEEMMKNFMSSLTATQGHDREARLEQVATLRTDES